MRVFVGIFCALSLVSSVSSSVPSAAYDPIGEAQNQLPDPPPAGYEIREATPVELLAEPRILGETDHVDKVIVVNLKRIEKMVASGGGGPEEVICVIAGVLNHEYEHTEDYGEASPPPAVGFNNGTCQHYELYAVDQAFFCAKAAMEAQGSDARNIFCFVAQSFNDSMFTYLPVRNDECEPELPVHPMCDDC